MYMCNEYPEQILGEPSKIVCNKSKLSGVFADRDFYTNTCIYVVES